LLWCHGVGEHGGRYDHIVQEFLTQGWQVILPDLRGQGRSEGRRSDIASFEDYLRDFDILIQDFALKPSRTVLYGHSMGGLIMTRMVQTRPLGWGALAMTAPLLGVAVPIPWWKWMLGRCLSIVAPRTHLSTGIQESNLTSDPEFLARRRADPLIQRGVTVEWFFAMLQALDDAQREAAKLDLPILILQGTADKTTDPNAPALWLNRTGNPHSKLIEYPGGLHELLNDTGWHNVSNDLIGWLNDRLPIPNPD